MDGVIDAPPAEVFGEEYFMRGRETGVSNYTNYSWKPELTIPACQKIKEYLGMRSGESFLDYGCSRGFYVKAMRIIGVKAFGVDVSEWAIKNCDSDVISHVSNTLPKRSFDWAMLKDLCEHLTLKQATDLIGILNDRITKGILVIVPLAKETHGEYIRKEDEQDVTHVIRWTLDGWIKFLENAAPDFNVNASYNIHGIKPASSTVPHSCGFLTLIRP